jgi:hypothetical protein
MKKLIPIILAGVLCGGFIGVLANKASARISSACDTTCAGLTGDPKTACLRACNHDGAQCNVTSRPCGSCCAGGSIVGPVPNPAAMCYMTGGQPPTPAQQATYDACVKGCLQGCKTPVLDPGN